MVMVTRSAYRRASESFNSSDISQNNIIPPWCSSGRLIKRKEKHKAPKPDWEMRSMCPYRENIWEYLQDDKDTRDFHCIRERPAKNHSKVLRNKQARGGKNFLKLLIFFLFTAAVAMGMDYASSEDSECCHQMAHLAAELFRARRALRSTSRLRRTLLLISRNVPEFTNVESIPQNGHLMEARASKGGSTTEWGGRIALWGVIPLWRAAPPPDIILSMRPPTPSDCWPFSGSYGEVVIELSHKATLHYVGVEHVRPDTARSAPKEFVVYSILENDTRWEIARGTYTYKKAAKQYFPLSVRDFPVKSVAFKVLSNQGQLMIFPPQSAPLVSGMQTFELLNLCQCVLHVFTQGECDEEYVAPIERKSGYINGGYGNVNKTAAIYICLKNPPTLELIVADTKWSVHF